MTKMTLENTVAELKAEISERGLDAQAEEYATQNNKAISKFNKNDYLVVLGDKEVVEKPAAPVVEETPPVKSNKLSPDEKSAETAAHNKTMVLCVVTDHFTGYSLDDEVPGRVFRCSWGNKLGSVEARVRLDGEPQYLHVGTIRLLKKITMPHMGKDAAGKEQVSNGNKRFTVVVVDGWSEDKLEQMRKAQKVRNA